MLVLPLLEKTFIDVNVHWTTADFKMKKKVLTVLKVDSKKAISRLTHSIPSRNRTWECMETSIVTTEPPALVILSVAMLLCTVGYHVIIPRPSRTFVLLTDALIKSYLSIASSFLMSHFKECIEQ